MKAYYLPNLSEFQFFCFPQSVGCYVSPEDHNVDRPEGVRDFSLHFITSGSGFVELEGKTYKLGKGDAFLHFPNEAMRYYRNEEEPWHIYWIQFYGHTLTEYFMHNGLTRSSIWTQKSTSLLAEAFNRLFEEIEQYNFLRPSTISVLTYSMLLEFIGNIMPYSSYSGAKQRGKVTDLLPEMQAQAHLPFDLNYWADRADVTPNYFCNLFKLATRMTPISYITKCRIQLSKQLLLANPSMSVKEVAILSGYPGISYFNKKFMESEGMTPVQFRKLH